MQTSQTWTGSLWRRDGFFFLQRSAQVCNNCFQNGQTPGNNNEPLLNFYDDVYLECDKFVAFVLISHSSSLHRGSLMCHLLFFGNHILVLLAVAPLRQLSISRSIFTNRWFLTGWQSCPLSGNFIICQLSVTVHACWVTAVISGKDRHVFVPPHPPTYPVDSEYSLKWHNSHNTVKSLLSVPPRVLMAQCLNTGTVYLPGS